MEMRPLYLATNVEELERIAGPQSDAKFSRIEVFCKAADRLLEQCRMHTNDEELHYVYLVRYVRFVRTAGIRQKDDKFMTVRFGKQLEQCREKADEVKKNLIRRYAERGAASGATPSLKSSSVVQSKKIIADDSSIVPAKRMRPVFKSTMFATPEELYDARQKDVGLVVFDVRSAEDYAGSHIKNINNINIPDGVIKAGYSAYVVGQNLPKESKEAYDGRGKFAAIILMDWRSTEATFTNSTVCVLHSILTNWDMIKYENPILVLDGGYLGWLEKYPTFSTNPSVHLDQSYGDMDDLLSLDAIHYPLEATFDTKEVEGQLKGIAATLQKELEGETELIGLYKQLGELLDSTRATDETRAQERAICEKAKQLESKLTELSNRRATDMAKMPKVTVDELRELQDTVETLEDSVAAVIAERYSITEACEAKQKKLEEAVAPSGDGERAPPADAEKAIPPGEPGKTVPPINRDLKPANLDKPKPSVGSRPHGAALPKPNHFIPAIDRRKKPKIRETTLSELLADGRGGHHKGLTGLYNIRNTCYQNTFVQCLRHLPAVSMYFLQKTHLINERKFKIARELGELVSGLWLSGKEYLRPQEFFEKCSQIDPLYAAGTHEDIHQFMLNVLEGLTEDTGYKIKIDPGASPSMLAWHAQLGENRSFFSENFFHQVTTKLYCPGCNKKSLRYDMENAFMLSIPKEMEGGAFKLVDLLNIYLAGERNNPKMKKSVCKDCKVATVFQRTITRYPRFAVVCIKRYMHTGHSVSSLRKNEEECSFSESLVIGEVEYKLHSIAQHIGTIDKGHYTAACLNPLDNRWYHFNDWKVNAVDIHTPEVRRGAYLLFYQVRSEKKLMNIQTTH